MPNTQRSPAAAAKPAVKATPAPAAKKRPAAASEPVYSMPREVQEWIERATSTMNHLRGQVDRLKAENEELKAYKKWAESRILRSEHE